MFKYLLCSIIKTGFQDVDNIKIIYKKMSEELKLKLTYIVIHFNTLHFIYILIASILNMEAIYSLP